ncbi:RILP-like protein 1 [Centruroides vittatus]|uniref:RILP-like protein 1 n=1 Tax=Centruroides vittatus TaxID=120091 RepID=UPI0035108C8D
MESYETEKCLSIQEVFDGVVEIAEGFEKIIDSQGDVEIVKSVLKKVIWSLEHLRNCVLLNERIECELCDLKSKVTQLEYDKEEKAKLKKKFDEELEQIEEYWKKESKTLNTQITKLQQENQRLQKFQTETSEELNKEEENEIDDTVCTLREVINNQRNQIHAKDAEIFEKNGEIDALENQLSRMKELNEKFRNELMVMRRENQSLLEEKLELQGRVQEHQRELQLLQNALHEMLGSEINNIEETQSEDRNIEKLQLPRLTPAQLRRLLCEMNNVKLRLKYLEEEVSFYRERRPSLKMETEQAMKLEIEEQNISDNFLTNFIQHSDDSDQSGSQESDQSSEEDETYKNASDSETSMEAEWVTKSDVPAQSLVDQEIRDRNMMARRPSAINKFFRRIFSPFSAQEEQPLPLAYFAPRRASAGII